MSLKCPIRPNRIRLLKEGFDVGPLVQQLEANSELWNANRFRTEGGYGNPHSELSDIIVRYNDWSNWTKDRVRFNDEHDSVWWDSYQKLPAIADIFRDVMHYVGGERLGMVLITKIPPHSQCAPHRDAGWHAQYYQKYAVQVKANPAQAFCFEGEQLITKPGDLFSFDNEFTHWVTNDSDEERITLIICIRGEHKCPQVG